MMPFEFTMGCKKNIQDIDSGKDILGYDDDLFHKE